MAKEKMEAGWARLPGPTFPFWEGTTEDEKGRKDRVKIRLCSQSMIGRNATILGRNDVEYTKTIRTNMILGFYSWQRMILKSTSSLTHQERSSNLS